MIPDTTQTQSLERNVVLNNIKEARSIKGDDLLNITTFLKKTNLNNKITITKNNNKITYYTNNNNSNNNYGRRRRSYNYR